MSLVSKNNVATNKFELEIQVPAEDFEKACEQVYKKKRQTHRGPWLPEGPRSPENH